MAEVSTPRFAVGDIVTVLRGSLLGRRYRVVSRTPPEFFGAEWLYTIRDLSTSQLLERMPEPDLLLVADAPPPPPEPPPSPGVRRFDVGDWVTIGSDQTAYRIVDFRRQGGTWVYQVSGHVSDRYWPQNLLALAVPVAPPKPDDDDGGGGILPDLGGLVDSLRDLVVGTVNGLIGQVQSMMDGLIANVQSIFASAVGSIAGIVGGMVDTLRSVFGGLLDSFGGAVDAIVSPIVGRIIGFVDAALGSLRAFAQPIQQALASVAQRIASLPDTIGSALGEAVAAVGDLTLRLSSDFGKSITSALEAVTEIVTGVATTVAESVINGLQAGFAGLTDVVATVPGALDALWSAITEASATLNDTVESGVGLLSDTLIRVLAQPSTDSILSLVGELIQAIPAGIADTGQILAQDVEG